jgi:hypothetical protein
MRLQLQQWMSLLLQPQRVRTSKAGKQQLLATMTCAECHLQATHQLP